MSRISPWPAVGGQNLDLRSVARPVMRELVKRVQESCYLGVADRHQCLYIEAAPIKDRSGAVVAAVSLSGPSPRFTPAAIRRFEKEVKQASLEISRTLRGAPSGLREIARVFHDPARPPQPVK